ncbi:hypothetical protein MTO96_037255 [Rhipicephalus appendiculatus]
MAVVVQELVAPDAAGVMFTCDPLTGNPGIITVTANYGIGEEPTIESSQIGSKSVFTIPSENDGVATVSVSAEKCEHACISEKDTKTLASIGSQIEKTYTTPQDMEWAFRDGKFFLLQSRPVTTFLRESDCEMVHEFDEGVKSAKEILTTANVS